MRPWPVRTDVSGICQKEQCQQTRKRKRYGSETDKQRAGNARTPRGLSDAGSQEFGKNSGLWEGPLSQFVALKARSR